MNFLKDNNLTAAPAQRLQVTEHQCHRARLTAAHHATDAADLAHLLDILGLIPGPEADAGHEDNA